MDVNRTLAEYVYLSITNQELTEKKESQLAKLQNIGPLIYISLNYKGAYYVLLRSSKDFYTCKTDGPMWPCIL